MNRRRTPSRKLQWRLSQSTVERFMRLAEAQGVSNPPRSTSRQHPRFDGPGTLPTWLALTALKHAQIGANTHRWALQRPLHPSGQPSAKF
jgi:hypothetical protein